MVESLQLFTTTDGKTFKTLEQANFHENLIKAKTQYEDARHDYVRALAKSFQTADGEQFDFSTLKTYYRVVDIGKPHIQEVSFYIWHCDIDDRDNAVIRQKRESDGAWISYTISDLYYHRKNAELKLLEFLELWVAQQQAELESLKERLANR